MRDLLGPLLIVVGILTMMFFILLPTTSDLFSEVDGTVRDKYISNSDERLLVDYSTGETDDWYVIAEVYEDCEIGDSIHRTASGDITCS